MNTIVFDEKAEQDILIGYCNIEGFTSGVFNDWFQLEYDNYTVDNETIDQVNLDNIDNLEITIVLGTWCSDSQREFPRFYKILEKLNFSFEYLTIISVNRAKQAPETTVGELNIELVPTFIFSKNGKEIGRIIETPEVSLEKTLKNNLINLIDAAFWLNNTSLDKVLLETLN
ncbi:MAG: thioredoxin family protein [Marinilabiliales bacterium]|nr:thioredoxin family protein [Marinilabiliales bacterium]